MRVTKCVSRGVAGPQKPCGFAAALGRRYGVAHNSTGPTFAGKAIAQQKPASGSLRHPAVMQFYSRPLMHFLPGVDTRLLSATNIRRGEIGMTMWEVACTSPFVMTIGRSDVSSI